MTPLMTPEMRYLGSVSREGSNTFRCTAGEGSKMMRHADIRTTMNIYGDVVTDEMTTAGSKVAQLAFRANGAHAERRES